ncbi:14146_t:CDS:2 [Gigaspora margarita]|uniref:14146_t:CDS:1 n=1 Tax=Gigaspora margarita TaxID=4874 RepID=A0ABN7USD5_GIGMA|nr:14146_t:CDS:2 [Gigaspora margarita]
MVEYFTNFNEDRYQGGDRMEVDEIGNDDIPQISTIHNWIGRYSREFNHKGTIIALETFNASGSSSNKQY